MQEKWVILKRSRDFLLYTKKETSRVLFTIKYGCKYGSTQVRALGPCSSIYLPLNKTTSCQYKLSKKCSILERYNRSCRVRIEINIGTRVLSQNKISVLVRVRVIEVIVQWHSCFTSYVPELVPLFQSAIKHGYRCFIS